MIVEFGETENGWVYLNTDHIVDVRVILARNPDERTQIEVTMTNGKPRVFTEEYQPDGMIGPDSLRVMARLVPEEFRYVWEHIAEQRSEYGLLRAKEADIGLHDAA